MFIELWPEGAPLALGEGLQDRPGITPFLADGTGPRPAIIINPGGGYAMLAEHEGEPIAHWLNRLGISAFVLHYRVKPYAHPCPLLDAKRAIRYVRASSREWNIDPARIGMMGFSAGGHLACTAATHSDNGNPSADDPVERLSSRLDLLIMCYGSVSFMKREYTAGSMINLIGEHPPDELRRYYSNELHVTTEMPATFLWHTSNDRVQNSLLLAAALKDHDIPFELHIYEEGRHGLGLAEENPYARTWTSHCEAWLKKRGF